MITEADADKKVEKLKRVIEGSAGSMRGLLQAHQTDTAINEHSEHLLEEVLSRQNMQQALRRVVSNGGAPGIDGLRVEDLKAYCQANWPEVRQQLLRGTYQPQAVRRVDIPKSGGGTRMLGIPTVVDRLIQQAIQQVLQPALRGAILSTQLWVSSWTQCTRCGKTGERLSTGRLSLGG